MSYRQTRKKLLFHKLYAVYQDFNCPPWIEFLILSEHDELDKKPEFRQWLYRLAKDRIGAILVYPNINPYWNLWTNYPLTKSGLQKFQDEILTNQISKKPQQYITGILCNAHGLWGYPECIELITEFAMYDKSFYQRLNQLLDRHIQQYHLEVPKYV